MDNEKKKTDGIPFIVPVIVLFVNLLLYKWDEMFGGIFFGIIGFWFLLYALYKIAKIFKPDL